MTLKRIAIVLLALMVVLLAGTGATIVWLMNADLKPLAEKYASEAAGRPATLESLTVAWGNPLGIEAKGLKVANAPWASAPSFVSIDNISATLDPWSILSGPLKFQKVTLARPVIVLERGEGENRNWRSGQAGPQVAKAVMPVPAYRLQFPSFLDLAVTDGQVIYKSKSYNMQLDLHDVTAHTPDDTSRIGIAATGVYNGVPVAATADTDSFMAMRDAAKPFGIELMLRGLGAEIDFKGGMRDPLGFDGVEGPHHHRCPEVRQPDEGLQRGYRRRPRLHHRRRLQAWRRSLGDNGIERQDRHQPLHRRPVIR